MQRLVHSIAMAAAFIVLAAALWQDWTLGTTLKRLVLSYLGFFILAAVGALVVRTAALLERPETAREVPRPRDEKP